MDHKIMDRNPKFELFLSKTSRSMKYLFQFLLRFFNIAPVTNSTTAIQTTLTGLAVDASGKAALKRALEIL